MREGRVVREPRRRGTRRAPGARPRDGGSPRDGAAPARATDPPPRRRHERPSQSPAVDEQSRRGAAAREAGAVGRPLGEAAATRAGAQPRPGRRAGAARHRRRDPPARRRSCTRSTTCCTILTSAVGDRRGHGRHDLRDHRRRHRPVGRRDRRARRRCGAPPSPPRSYGAGGMIFTALVVGRRLPAWSTACSSRTAGWCRSSPRWPCWSPPAGWPRRSPTGRRQIVTDAVHQRPSPTPTCSASRCWSTSSPRSSRLGWVVLNRTTFGRRTFAVGGNPEAARLAGIDVRRHTVAALRRCPACAAASPRSCSSSLTTTGSSTPRQPLRARRDRRRDHRRHRCSPAAAAPSIGSLLGVLVFTTITNLFVLNNLADRGPEHRQGRDHRRRRPGPAARRAPEPASPDPTTATSPLQRRVARSMSEQHVPTIRRTLVPTAARLLFGAAAVGAGALLAACTSNDADDATAAADHGRRRPRGDNDAPGKTVTIGFSAPAGRPRLDRRDHQQRQGAGRRSTRDVTLEAVEADQRHRPSRSPPSRR